MGTRVLLIVMLASAVAKAQVAPPATGTKQMETPPPVNGANFPTQVAVQERSNFLSAGLVYSTAYVSNLYAGSAGPSIAEKSFSIMPTIVFDDTARRRHMAFTYSPGFTFYEPSTALNEVDHTAKVDYEFRITPYVKVRVYEQLDDSSTSFNPADPGGSVSGSPVSSTPGAIPPFAKRLTNSANGELTLQTGPNTMIGASGSSTVLHYPNPAQTPGLYDSNSRGGTVFYNHRISIAQYFGVSYQYQDMLTYPKNGTDSTQTHTPMGYYTLYPSKRLSLSVSAGPQHYQVAESPLPATSQWGPFVTPSLGWHGNRTNIAASYSQAVTGGGGLLGAFHTKNANATARWQMSRTWTASGSGAYSIIKSVSTYSAGSGQDGNTVTATATLERSIRDHFTLAFNYVHVRQSYGGIAAISANPNSDRGTISINWHFTRPLGK